MKNNKLAFPHFLQSNPDELRKFLNLVGDALFVVDRDQNIVFWNDQAHELTGFSSKEVLGRHCLTGIRCTNCLSGCSLFDKGGVDNKTIELITQQGETKKVTKKSYLLKDKQGNALFGVEWLRDETELSVRIASCKLQSKIISEREHLQSAILGSIKEGVITIDLNRRITSFSRRAETITHIQAQDAIGKPCQQVIGQHMCNHDCPAERCLETGAAQSEGEGTLAGNQQVLEIAIPLKDEQGDIIGTVLILEQIIQHSDPTQSNSFAGMVGRSAAMRKVFQIIEQVAPSDVTVLVSGPSGTGKEMVAKALHRLSKRSRGPFQAINCAALPESLLESELFGSAKGAFTGSHIDRAGKIEAAQGGTLFLDEVAESSLSTQAKLLRFVQEHEYQRIGENITRKADVRVVTATNRNLEQALAQGFFREDLYYRLHVIPIELPALLERPDDIPLLANHLLEKIGHERGRQNLSLTQAAMQRILQHSWPGNVRELENTLEYAVAMAPGRRIRPQDFPHNVAGTKRRYKTLGNNPSDERQRIQAALSKHNANRTHAAKELGMDRVTLYRKIKKYNLS